jgi:hypothetical protein
MIERPSSSGSLGQHLGNQAVIDGSAAYRSIAPSPAAGIADGDNSPPGGFDKTVGGITSAQIAAWLGYDVVDNVFVLHLDLLSLDRDLVVILIAQLAPASSEEPEPGRERQLVLVPAPQSVASRFGQIAEMDPNFAGPSMNLGGSR